jgi:hypothetical protein
MSEYEYPHIPEFVIDHIGQEVRPGDAIVYAVREGDTAAMRSGVVQNFQFPKQKTYASWGNNVLKIKVLDPISGRKSVIEQHHRRYAKVVLPDTAVVNSK